MMKKIVAWLFFMMLGLLGIALVAPSFIDWNKHKDLIVSQLEDYVDRKVEVAGEVSFSVLPNPRILLQDVSVEGILKLKTLEASIGLKPLLEGKFEVENVNLVEPQVTFEVDENGKASWTGVLKEREKTAGGLKAGSISLNQVTLSHGKLSYISKVSGLEWHIDQLNLRIAADTLLGPYLVTGDMLYNDKPVNVEIGTGKYDRTAPVPLRMTFMPIEGLPEVKLNGVIDLKSGFDVQGEVGLEQGTVASLFASPFLKDIYFLNEIASLSGMLEVRGGDIRVTEIKGKIGQKGSVSGKLDVKLVAGKKTAVTADIDAKDLKVYGKAGFMPAPENFDLKLKADGKNIQWGDMTLPAVSATAESGIREWVVKSMALDMPGKSSFRLSGVVTPSRKTAAMTMDIDAEDLSAVVAGVPFKAFKMTKGTLDITPEKISIYNFDAAAGEGQKIAGALHVDRASETFAADATLQGSLQGITGFIFKGKITGKAVEGEVTADVIDTDALPDDVDAVLDVKAKKLAWRQNDILDASMKMELHGTRTKVSGLKGTLWGGALAAEAEGDNGAGTLKGSLTGAELDTLRTHLELDGFTVGKGDIEFDLKDDGSREKMFHAISGDVKFRAGTLTIDKFDTADLGKLLGQLSSPPENLKELAVKSLKGGDGVFSNVEAAMKIGGGKFTFDGFTLSNADADIKVKGEYDLGPEKYAMTADVKPRDDVPAFTISAPGYVMDDKPFRDYIIRKNPPPPAPAPVPEPAPVLEALPAGENPAEPAAPEAPAVPDNPVGDILNRLDEEEAPAADPAAVPETQEETPALPEEVPAGEPAAPAVPLEELPDAGEILPVPDVHPVEGHVIEEDEAAPVIEAAPDTVEEEPVPEEEAIAIP